MEDKDSEIERLEKENKDLDRQIYMLLDIIGDMQKFIKYEGLTERFEKWSEVQSRLKSKSRFW